MKEKNLKEQEVYIEFMELYNCNFIAGFSICFTFIEIKAKTDIIISAIWFTVWVIMCKMHLHTNRNNKMELYSKKILYAIPFLLVIGYTLVLNEMFLNNCIGMLLCIGCFRVVKFFLKVTIGGMKMKIERQKYSKDEISKLWGEAYDKYKYADFHLDMGRIGGEIFLIIVMLVLTFFITKVFLGCI